MPEFDREVTLRRLAQQLESIDSQRQMVELVSAELRGTLGYRTTWLSVISDDREELRVLAAELSGGDDLWDSAVPLPIAGDRYVTRLIESGQPQVIVDAQVSEDVNREVVEQLGNRTVINVPVLLDGKMFGAIGTGTFGDEGPRPPSEDDLEYLRQLGEVAGVALSRVLRLAGHHA